MIEEHELNSLGFLENLQNGKLPLFKVLLKQAKFWLVISNVQRIFILLPAEFYNDLQQWGFTINIRKFFLHMEFVRNSKFYNLFQGEKDSLDGCSKI